MRHRETTTWGSGSLWVAMLAMVFVVGTGCSVKTGLEGQKCSEEQEGKRADGRVCQGGYWVETEDAGMTDIQPEDGNAGNCYYQGEAQGICQQGIVVDDGECEAPPNYESTETSCADGVDNDCDGEVDGGDDDCECSPGETESCYSGPSGTRDQGLCEAGMRTCNDDGVWSECEGERTPTEENCATPKDEDCGDDGNAGCGCNYDDNDQGVCGEATVGPAGNCQEPAGYDTTDDEQKAGRCNDDLDNDCDGVVNENCGCNYEGNDEGVCKGATIDPQSGDCAEPDDYDDTEDEAAAGLCDGKDNDCDGERDENCECTNPGETKTFYDGSDETEGVGICGEGVLTCQQDGDWKETDGQQLPEMETCNNRDDDCDGMVDENVTDSCYTASDDSTAGTGLCEKGTKTCSNGQFGACQGETTPAQEVCDGEDNDCDGTVDEDLQQECYTGDSGTAGTGICQRGTETCSGGQWGSCSGEVTPVGDEEQDCSNGTDDDCDGETDEGCPCDYDGTSDGVCGGSTTTDGGDCAEPNNYEAPDETSCNDGNDNDCDGEIDEGCPCDYNGISLGVCGDATTKDGGDCEEPDAYEATESSCDDGYDNDCDGAVDYGDIDCQKPAGSSCSGDDECYSGVCDTDTNNGTCAHRVFVSSNKYNGSLGGMSGADNQCGRLASNANLEGNWRAVISDNNQDAKDRITIEAEVVRMDGQSVAEKGDLWDPIIGISNAIEIDENENAVPTCTACGDDRVWTGTDDDGTVTQDTCGGWQNTNPNGSSGDAGDIVEWIYENNGPDPCGNQQRIYCIDGQP